MMTWKDLVRLAILLLAGSYLPMLAVVIIMAVVEFSLMIIGSIFKDVIIPHIKSSETGAVKPVAQ